MENDGNLNQNISVLERIGAVGTLIAAIFVVAFSIFSLVIDLIVEFNLAGVIVDLLFLGLGFITGYFSFRSFGKTLYYERMINFAFEEGMYKRIEPILRKVAEVSVDLEDIENHLDLVDKKVQTVLEEQVNAQKSVEVEKKIALGTSIGFAIKAILLVVVTMSAFSLMMYTPTGQVHYITLIFYLLWWLLISSEFKLYDRNTALMVLVAPILLVPVGVMTLDAFMQINSTIAIFYAGLGLYALLYYLWAVYETKGTLPFSGPDLQNLDKSNGSSEDLIPKVGFLRAIFGIVKTSFSGFLGFRQR